MIHVCKYANGFARMFRSEESWKREINSFMRSDCDCEQLPNGDYIFKKEGKEVARFETRN